MPQLIPLKWSHMLEVHNSNAPPLTISHKLMLCKKLIK